MSLAALDEVTTTAERREAVLQKVPVSITALTEDELEKRRVQEVTDIGRNVPNMLTTFSSSSPQNTRIFLRGLGQSETTMPTAEPSVGVYVDDVYVARANGANQRLVDVERVEVLRGPQGTLYGRNTISGAMKFVTRKPDEDARADASIAVGNYNLVDAKVSGSTPFAGDNWAVGASATYYERDGIWTRYSAPGVSTGDEVGAREYGGARAEIAYIGSDRFDAFASIAYVDDKSDALYLTPIDDNQVPLTGGDLFTTLTSQDQFADTEQINADLTLTWDLGGWEITGFRTLENDSLIDISGQNSWYIDTKVSSDQFSQELQALGTSFDESLEWIVGAYYLREEADVDTLNTIAGIFTNQQIYTQELDSYAVFAQATWYFVPQVGLTLGGRYTVDDKSLNGEVIGMGPPSWVSGSTSNSKDWSEFTPKIGLDYQVNDDTLIYAYVAQGFQAGGFQARAFSVIDLDESYDPTTVWTYEMGAKMELIDNRVRLNASFFHNDFEDLQLTSLNEEQGGGTIVQNAAEATVHGFELELMTQPIDSVNIWGSLSTAWSNYQELDPSLAGRIELGDRIAGTPELMVGLGFDYSWNFGNGGELQLGLDYYHQKSHYPGATNSEVTKVPTLNLLNGFARYLTPSGRWEFAVFGKNLTDQDYWFTGFDFSSFNSVFAADPVTYQAAVTFRYD
jgi:iron complex outermembrane receptor protein